jgi:hypothetical protein
MTGVHCQKPVTERDEEEVSVLVDKLVEACKIKPSTTIISNITNKELSNITWILKEVKKILETKGYEVEITTGCRQIRVYLSQPEENDGNYEEDNHNPTNKREIYSVKNNKIRARKFF